MASKMPNGPSRIESLTGIRGIAAIIVVMYHLHIVRPTGHWLDLAQHGFIGVGLFYILSGFVLSWTWKSDESPTTFFWKRFARLYPAYIAVVLASALLDVVQRDAPSFTSLAAAIGLAQSWVPDKDVYFGIRPVFWSLSTEAAFYLSFPFIIRPISRLGRLQLRSLGFGCFFVIGCIALAGLSYSPFWVWFVYIFPISRLPEFIIGIIIGLETRAGTAPRIPLPVSIIAVVIGFSMLSQVPASLRPAATMTLPFALLLLSASQADLNRQFSPFRGRLLVQLGLASYALYLIHTVIIGGADRVIATPNRWSDTAVVLSACLAAAAMYSFFERPVDAFLRKLAKPGSRSSALASGEESG